MNPAVNTVAIVGAGAAGLAAAIRLARRGVQTDLYERNSELAVTGSGITLQGNALRVFDDLGIWETARAKGYPFEGLTIRAPGPGAPVVADLPEVKTGGPDYPAGMGMHRPDLASIMVDAAVAAGARILFGQEVTELSQDGEGVDLATEAGHMGRYDLVIGADGLRSSVRAIIGIDTEPVPNGMGIWRAFIARPAGVEHTELYYGGPMLIAGYTPTSEDSAYAILVEKARNRAGLTSEQARAIMLEESAAYEGPWEDIRISLSAGDTQVNYTQFTSHLVEEPWNRNRVVLIGDAAHSCPPTIAQGAAQSLEDALVLTELLLERTAVDDTLWEEFHARRVPRAAAVVEASSQLAQWQLDGEVSANTGELIMGLAQKMAEPT